MLNPLLGAAVGAALMLLFLAVLRLYEIRDTLNRISAQLALMLVSARAQSKPLDVAMLKQGIDCFAGKRPASTQERPGNSVDRL